MFSIGGASLPSSRSRRLGLVILASLVIAAALTFMTPSAQAVDKVAVTDGTLTWGVKQSWRSYIGEAGITVSGGVTRTTDGAFTWPITTGTYDDATKALDLRLAGSVRFTAHEGALDMTISSPRLVISGDEPQLFATVVSKDESSGQLVDFGETVQSKAARLTVAAPSDAARVITTGTLDWGIKKSFRDYVVGSIAHGAITVSDGAEKNDDGTFAFSVDSGTWDPKTQELSVDYDGTVQFTGHDGLLEVTVTDPELDATGDAGVLTAQVVSKSLEAGQPTDYGRIAIADVDTDGAISAAGSSLTIKDAPATLTETGAPAFGGFYTAGTALDPIGGTATLGAAVGGEPAVPAKPPTVAPSTGRVTPQLSAKLSKTSIRARQRAKVKIAVTLPGAKAGTLPTGQLVVRDGGTIISVRSLKASHRGRITVTLPRLAQGRHYVKVTLNGNPVQLPVTSPYRTLRVR
ncbi:HtaA domain-containing protein [Aeromicrobium fastidiosum]|uniref:Htaa domain-containing protein n=1 Tax=Aeromicrobium fastidiosum TaxID=52699 RepID=A0A641APG5_9ACTN|nr:HtaA domain-containing protein [Aeromicrobium fastidiosum]KAA1379996.1 hypothetical protein ESP62_001965 [Aeromicrobium fastidiosum]MBP2389516.1 hypothetical protein [Aeromicrobium fastidiosum]